MSDDRFSSGLMAPLLKPAQTREEILALRDRLEAVGLQLNYEGTLVFSIHFEEQAGGNFIVSSQEAQTQFYTMLHKAQVEVTHEAAFYAANWYNGTDSVMSETTLDEFVKQIKG